MATGNIEAHNMTESQLDAWTADWDAGKRCPVCFGMLPLGAGVPDLYDSRHLAHTDCGMRQRRHQFD